MKKFIILSILFFVSLCSNFYLTWYCIHIKPVEAKDVTEIRKEIFEIRAARIVELQEYKDMLALADAVLEKLLFTEEPEEEIECSE